MAFDPVIIGSFIGFILIAAYFYVCWSRKTEPELMEIITILMSCVGFVSGMVLICIALFSDFVGLKLGAVADSKIAIIVGGVVLCYVSGHAVWKIFSKKNLKTAQD